MARKGGMKLHFIYDSEISEKDDLYIYITFKLDRCRMSTFSSQFILSIHLMISLYDVYIQVNSRQ